MPRSDHSHDHEHDHAPGEHAHPATHGDEHGAGTSHAHAHRGGVLGAIASIVSPHGHELSDKVDPQLESSAAGIRATQLSLVGLALIAAIEAVIVVASGSVALLADMIHNLGDAATAIPLWIAFSVGRRPANRRYTYGYGKLEDIAGVFIVLVIAFSTVVAVWQSIDRLLNPRPITDLLWVGAAALVGFVGQELIAQYRIFWGRQIGSAALVADGYHARTDGFASLAVLVGAVGVALGFPQADPLAGLLISAVILALLRQTAITVWHRLMDAVDPELSEAIERASLQPGVQEVTSARLRWIGHRLEAETHVTVDADLSTKASHDIAESVRHAIVHDVPKIRAVVVHVDPCTHAVADPHDATSHHMPALPRASRSGMTDAGRPRVAK